VFYRKGTTGEDSVGKKIQEKMRRHAEPPVYELMRNHKTDSSPSD